MRTALGMNVAITIVPEHSDACQRCGGTKVSLEAYITIKGLKQGDISQDASKPDSIGQVAKGDSSKQGKITVVGFTAALSFHVT
ncbi:hypothetical protein ACVWWG_001645 [Bradyrhizobium sp. LB7.2]